MLQERRPNYFLTLMYSLLCLLGDFDMQVWSDSFVTVSLKETTGSETRISAPPIKSSWRSFRQISKWSSPAPAMICSPTQVIWILRLLATINDNHEVVQVRLSPENTIAIHVPVLIRDDNGYVNFGTLHIRGKRTYQSLQWNTGP